MGIFDKDSSLNPFDGHFFSRLGWGVVMSLVIMLVLGLIWAVVLPALVSAFDSDTADSAASAVASEVTGDDKDENASLPWWVIALLYACGYMYSVNVGLKMYESKRCNQVGVVSVV